MNNNRPITGTGTGAGTQITREELNHMIDLAENPELNSTWTGMISAHKNAILNEVNRRLSSVNPENISIHLDKYLQWQKKNSPLNNKFEQMWAKFKEKELLNKVVTDKTNKYLDTSNVNVLAYNQYNQFLHTNKEIIQTSLKDNVLTKAANKPLGSLGDITLNQCITKGLDIVESPIIQMIKENVNLNVLGTSITSLILYRAIVKLYVNNAYSSGSAFSYSEAIKAFPNIKSKEIILFMILGAPFIAGSLISISSLTKTSTKVIVNLTENSDLETGSSSINKNNSYFLFLNKFLNKLPRWLKAMLKYIVLYLIGMFILSVIGYKSNILIEIYSQFYVYLGIFLKI